jgi:hypothetical protein
MKQVILQLKNALNEEILPKLKLVSKKTSIFGENQKNNFDMDISDVKYHTWKKPRKISINIQNARKTGSILQYLIQKNK